MKACDMDEELSHLFDLDWRWELEDNPEASSQYGAHDVEWSTPLQRVDPASYEKRF